METGYGKPCGTPFPGSLSLRPAKPSREGARFLAGDAPGPLCAVPSEGTVKDFGRQVLP